MLSKFKKCDVLFLLFYYIWIWLIIKKIYLYSSFGKDCVDQAIRDLIPYLPSIKGSLPALAKLRKIPILKLVYDDHRDKINYIEGKFIW